MSALIRFNKFVTLTNIIQKSIIQQNKNIIRCISTSQKNRETITAPGQQAVSPPPTSATSTTTQDDSKFETKPKNWVSYGFDYKDEAEDRNVMKSTFFFSVTLCLVWAGFFFAYVPDTHLNDWSQREAYLVLRQREANGEELISRDYIDPSLMILPSDEELGDMEIII